ncbi:hypothetical protein BH10CHL1_BH10CHL1_12990 [soil metagenome]
MASKTRRCFIFSCMLLSLLSSIVFPNSQPIARAAPEAPLDTPVPVINEVFSDWTLNDGMLYWAENCQIIPRQTAATAAAAFLRRKPVNGTTIRTLTEETDCVTKYSNMTADSTGLYYYDDVDQGIFFRPSGSPLDPPTRVMTTTVAPNFGTHLALGGDFIYWLEYNTGKIVRVHRDGTGFSEVVTGIVDARTFILVGSTLYWLAGNGLWSASVNCATLPCAGTKLADANGYYLMYVATGKFAVGGYSIYWVENGSPQSIHRYNCSSIVIFNCGAGLYYTAPANWSIGQPATDRTNLFWTESTGLDGHLVRKLLSNAGNTTDKDELVPNVPFIDLGRLFTDDQNVYYHLSGDTGNMPAGIYKLPFNASAIVRDLSADALEVTEGIQNLANDVNLVAKKPTYVRAYAKEISGPNAGSVDAWLYGTRNGNPLPGSPLHTLNGTRSLVTGGTYDRAQIDAGWLFQLPASWTSAGTINVQLNVDPRKAYADTNLANNTLTRSVVFTAKGPVCNIFIPVRTHAPIPSVNTPNFWPMIDYAKRLWPTYDYWSYHQDEPMEELQVCWAGPFPYPCSGPYEMPGDTWKVFITIGARDAFTDDPDACDDNNGSTHYVGMVHPSTDTGTTTGTGMTSVFNFAWVKFPDSSPINPTSPFVPDAGQTLAHELGHNLGRAHVDCGDPDDVDTSYPYPTTQIDNVGAANHYGFDIKTRKPIKPDGAKDFMSYCKPAWVSDYGWKKLFDNLVVTANAAQVNAATASATNLADAANVILVTGAVTPTQNSGFLGYAYDFPTSALSSGLLSKWQAHTTAAVNAAAAEHHEPEPTAANYHIQLLDAANNVLADNPITPIAPHIHDELPTPLVFITTFPAPAGTVARIDLLQDSTVIASRSPGLNAPTISILKPAGGETINDTLTLQWQASDADTNDILLYTVQYSPDNGVHWQSIANDFVGPRDSNLVNLTLNPVSLPGSQPNQARIRVAASDGYHTSLALSQPFTVSNRKPEPFIISPAAGETTPAGQTALLRGDANDAEDGGLSDTALSWTLDGQAVGTGEEVNVDGLAPGDYAALLTAQDSLPQTASAQATLKILPLGIPQASTPALDGFCDDAGYTNGTEIRLSPYSDSGQTSVHLLRDANYLWACFTGLKQGVVTPGAFAGLRVDVDNSRDNLAQPTDYGFLVGEDGGVATYAGDGGGGFAAAGPGGLQAQISALDSTWSAELRIDASKLGGWEHLASMSFGHYSVTAAGDDYVWPYSAVTNQPKTWALTALGTQPTLASLTPATATAGSAGAQMVISGTNFLTSTVVLWDGTPVPATFGSSTQMTATISAANLAAGHIAQVIARNPGNIDSNPLPFVVANPKPVINSLTPNAGQTGSNLAVTVNGANFINGAKVLWNGTEVPTTFVNGGQLTAQVALGENGEAQATGVVVLNPDPDAQSSNTALFAVQAESVDTSIFLPLIQR